jgi:hypothetical protein
MDPVDPEHCNQFCIIFLLEVVEGRTYSDNTDDACLIQCKFCLKPIALDCFTYHIKKAHSVLTQEYGEKTFLRRTYHR